MGTVRDDPDLPAGEGVDDVGGGLGRVHVHRDAAGAGIVVGGLSLFETPEIRDANHVSHVTASTTDEIDALFARVRAVYEGGEIQDLRPDQRRLVQLVYDRFARNGATLDGNDKARYAEIDQRLSELHTRFANNVLADEDKYVLCITEDQLGGFRLTLDGLRRRDELVFEACRRRGAPWVVTFGGGYARDVADTVAIHTGTVRAARDVASGAQ